MPYFLPALVLFVLVVGTAIYCTRASWLPKFDNVIMRFPAVDLALPFSGYFYARLPQSFTGDVEAGLSSSTFDLAGNIADGDGRAGLDDEAKREILSIMKKRRLQFDDARRVYMENRFRANGIDADGRPRDPKFVSFS